MAISFHAFSCFGFGFCFARLSVWMIAPSRGNVTGRIDGDRLMAVDDEAEILSRFVVGFNCWNFKETRDAAVMGSLSSFFE